MVPLDQSWLAHLIKQGSKTLTFCIMLLLLAWFVLLWQTKVRRWVLQPCCQIESPLVLQATALDCELVPISPLAGSNNWYRLSSLMLSWYKIGGAKAWQWGPTKCHRLERAERHGFTSPDIVTFETPTTSFNRFHWSTLLFRVLFLLTVACP